MVVVDTAVAIVGIVDDTLPSPFSLLSALHIPGIDVLSFVLS